MIISEKVILREIEEEDLNSIVKWRNDPEIIRWLFSYLPLSEVKQRKWYEKYLDDDTQQVFIIEAKEEKTPIGTIGLTNIDYKNQKAELGILIDIPYQNRGLGKEALNLLIKFAFDEVNIRKIKASVFKENESAIKLYKSCGFIEEGILRKEVYKNGEFTDVMIMALFGD